MGFEGLPLETFSKCDITIYPYVLVNEKSLKICDHRERWKHLFFIREDSEMVIKLKFSEVYISSVQLVIKTSFSFFFFHNLSYYLIAEANGKNKF